jgi:hypothetical protein
MDENFDFDDIDDVPSAASIADSLNERIRFASANLWRCGAIVLSGDLESRAEHLPMASRYPYLPLQRTHLNGVRYRGRRRQARIASVV